MSAETILEKRVYIGGFKQPVTELDIRGRFTPFGQVESVDLPATTENNKCRGFGYVSIKITAGQWQRCTSIYGGTKWKGGMLRIEEAKEHYTLRLERERKEAKETGLQQTEPVIEKKRKSTEDVYQGTMAEDLNLVTSKNVDRYRGWTKGRYNRPVFKYKVAKPNGKMFTFDPVQYRNNFEKLFGSVRPKHWKDLQWEYDETQVAGDFELARQLPEGVMQRNEMVSKRMAKRMRMEEEARREEERIKNERMMAEMEQRAVNMDVVESDIETVAKPAVSVVPVADTRMIMAADDSDLEGMDADENVVVDMDSFEGAEELAALATSAPAKSNPDLLAKLASGVFDSDDEDELSNGALRTEVPAAKPLRAEAPLSAEEAVLAKERERMAGILGKMLGDVGESSVETGASKQAVSLDSEEENEEEESGSLQDASEKKSGGRKSATSMKDSDSSSSSSSDSDSSSDSGKDDSDRDDSSSSGSGSSSSSGGSDDDDGNNGKKSDGSDSDSSDSDSSDSDSDSSDSDSDSDSEKFEDAQSNMMEVDGEAGAETTSGLFGGSNGGALFGAASTGFRFTDALGLEADEPSALGQATEHEHEAPVTGGVRMAGEPLERNLNANRLPPFFGDVDAVTFKRPEPAFQRQKTEEELQRDLGMSRSQMIRDFKSQHQATVRQARKMQEKRKLKK
ncbi:hypothetical protein H4R99_003927 [Coemansia sp. RSA 1722]|nr:hypothetical protein LPJ57_006957 [Coemansia sp. RSA 486]KAJ2598879.1 hypothetical protein H4R99_003927 [Coemansia sp. RSA 1722]KAJ2638256.1 hypothetical protein GGF40_001791 [Coemansia sp. RSA 1286]